MTGPISPELKLSVALRNLASGGTFAPILYTQHFAIAKFLPLFCDVIYQALNEKYLEIPLTEKLKIRKN